MALACSVTLQHLGLDRAADVETTPGLRKDPTQVWRSGGALLRVAALKPLWKSCRPDRA